MAFSCSCGGVTRRTPSSPWIGQGVTSPTPGNLPLEVTVVTPPGSERRWHLGELCQWLQ